MAMKAQIQMAGVEWTILPAAKNFRIAFMAFVQDMFFPSFDDLALFFEIILFPWICFGPGTPLLEAGRGGKARGKEVGGHGEG